MKNKNADLITSKLHSILFDGTSGGILLNYNLIKQLRLSRAITLTHLLNNYLIAIEKNLLDENKFFKYDTHQSSKLVDILDSTIENCLKEFAFLNFIEIKFESNLEVEAIKVNEDEILKALSQFNDVDIDEFLCDKFWLDGCCLQEND